MLSPQATTPAPSCQTLLGPQERSPTFPPEGFLLHGSKSTLSSLPVLPPLGPLLQEALQAVTTPSLSPSHKNPLSCRSTILSAVQRAGQCLFHRVSVRGPRGGHAVLSYPGSVSLFHQTPTAALPAQRVANSGKAGVWEEDESRSLPALWLVCLSRWWDRTLESSGMRLPGAGGRTGAWPTASCPSWFQMLRQPGRPQALRIKTLSSFL